MSRDISPGRDGKFDYRPDAIIKILTLGDSGVGKTSFVIQYVDGVFTEKFIPTIGMDLKEKDFIYYTGEDDGTESRSNYKKIHLQLWDTAGQERFRSLTTAFFRDAMGFLLMFDLTLEESFVNVRSWLTQLQMHSSYNEPIIVLVGNKSDIPERKVGNEDIERLCNSIGVKYFETSAKSGRNVNEAVEGLLSQILVKIDCTPADLKSPMKHNEHKRKLTSIPETKEDSCSC